MSINKGRVKKIHTFIHLYFFSVLLTAASTPVEITMPSNMEHTSTSKKSNIQKKEQKMAEEVSPEERVRPVEVLEGSSAICGFCTALGECSVEAGGRERGGGGEGILRLLLYCTDTVFFSTSIS